MQKPTLWQIVARALALAGSITAVLAAIAQTAAIEQFDLLRQAMATGLQNVFLFWFAVFVLLFVLSCTLFLAQFYGASSVSGSFLSEDGILLFDREQHIAISVPTLKSILSTLGAEAGKGRANELLFRAGELAGKRFGSAFEGIYGSQIAPRTNKPWGALRDNEKLDVWERYDTTGGWGHVNAHKYDARSIVEVIYRHPALYEGPGGELFSWLLAGYSKEVAAALLKQNMHFDPAKGFLRDEGILRLQYSY